MRKAPLKIPYEAFDRTVSFDDRDWLIRKFLWLFHFNIRVGNYSSRMKYGYHFDSLSDFLEHQRDLRQGVDSVAFEAVQVDGVRYGDSQLEVFVTDGEKTAKLVHDTPPRRSPDYLFDPLYGAKTGDIIQIYRGVFIGNGSIRIANTWHIGNDAHYERLKESLRSMSHGLEEIL